MELAIPLLALGGMYVISNQSKPSNNSYKFKDDSKPGNLRENYTNMGQHSNYLPNTNIPPQNCFCLHIFQLMNKFLEYCLPP